MLHKKNPSPEQKISDPLLQEIKAATSLPLPLTAIIRSFFLLPPPTREMVLEAKADLNILKDKEYCWEGISVPLEPHTRCDMDLSELPLDGIILGELQKYPSPDEVKTRFESEAARQVKNWYETHGQFYSSVNFVGASLENAKLENLLLTSIDFSGTNLENTSLAFSILTGAFFNRTNLKRARLPFSYGGQLQIEYICSKNNEYPVYSSFFETDFSHADLYNSNFSEIYFFNVTFDMANLSEGIYDFARFMGCSMQKAKLFKGNFSSAAFSDRSGNHGPTNLTGINGTEADFRHADFKDANLTEAILSGAKLQHADFTNANLTNARLNDAHFELKDFSKEQILSFYYRDEKARDYIANIFDWMEKKLKPDDKIELNRAHLLIFSFINHLPYTPDGQNKLLMKFLTTGKLPNESFWVRASKLDDPNSLRSRLINVTYYLQNLHAPAVEEIKDSPRLGK